MHCFKFRYNKQKAVTSKQSNKQNIQNKSSVLLDNEVFLNTVETTTTKDPPPPPPPPPHPPTSPHKNLPPPYMVFNVSLFFVMD